jgi:hypothetical protein
MAGLAVAEKNRSVAAMEAAAKILAATDQDWPTTAACRCLAPPPVFAFDGVDNPQLVSRRADKRRRLALERRDIGKATPIVFAGRAKSRKTDQGALRQSQTETAT